MNTFTTSTIVSQAVSEEIVLPTMNNDYKRAKDRTIMSVAQQVREKK